jgi:hypothetical protein
VVAGGGSGGGNEVRCVVLGGRIQQRQCSDNVTDNGGCIYIVYFYAVPTTNKVAMPWSAVYCMTCMRTTSHRTIVPQVDYIDRG